MQREVTIAMPNAGGVLWLAASLTPDGTFTPGVRFERDDDGVLWRTSIGMQGEAIGPRERIEESE
jgi:hypothetical protein